MQIFLRFWNLCFHSPERLVCYIKRWKSFFTIFFLDLLHGNTGDSKGLQGVERVDRRLQGVTGGYKGLQGITKDYKRLFLTRTFPDTFTCLFCIKIKVKEISNFDQNGGNFCFTSSQESNETNFYNTCCTGFHWENVSFVKAEESGNAVKIAVVLCYSELTMQNDILAFMTGNSRQVILPHKMIKILICCFSPSFLFYFDCLRASYFTVRSIDTIKTFHPIFISFAYISRFSFLSGNH